MNGPAEGELVLAVTVEVDASRDAEFNRWYDEVHVPEVLACPGFRAAWRLRREDSGQRPRYVTCYLVEGPAALETPQLRAVRGWGPFEGEVEDYRRLWFRVVGAASAADAAGEAGDRA